jgi:hypothetical protein
MRPVSSTTRHSHSTFVLITAPERSTSAISFCISSAPAWPSFCGMWARGAGTARSRNGCTSSFPE